MEEIMPENTQENTFTGVVFVAGDKDGGKYTELQVSIPYTPTGDFRTDRAALSEAIIEKNPDLDILETSVVSAEDKGKWLSSFFLKLRLPDGKLAPIESVFHGCKKYKEGGPYTDIMEMKPSEAKKDPRIKNSGDFLGFEFCNHKFPKTPRTAFYDWLVCCALFQSHNRGLLNEAVKHSAFSDVMFFPEHSLNSPAASLARIVTLLNMELIGTKLISFDEFVKAGEKADVYKKFTRGKDQDVMKESDEIPLGPTESHTEHIPAPASLKTEKEPPVRKSAPKKVSAPENYEDDEAEFDFDLPESEDEYDRDEDVSESQKVTETKTGDAPAKTSDKSKATPTTVGKVDGAEMSEKPAATSKGTKRAASPKTIAEDSTVTGSEPSATTAKKTKKAAATRKPKQTDSLSL